MSLQLVTACLPKHKISQSCSTSMSYVQERTRQDSTARFVEAGAENSTHHDACYVRQTHWQVQVIMGDKWQAAQRATVKVAGVPSSRHTC